MHASRLLEPNFDSCLPFRSGFSFLSMSYSVSWTSILLDAQAKKHYNCPCTQIPHTLSTSSSCSALIFKAILLMCTPTAQSTPPGPLPQLLKQLVAPPRFSFLLSKVPLKKITSEMNSKTKEHPQQQKGENKNKFKRISMSQKQKQVKVVPG